MSFSEDVERSALSKSGTKMENIQTEKSKANITETEINDNTMRTRSKWRRFMDASSRQLSAEEVGRKRAWYARGVVVLTVFSIIGALAFL
jgi:hypothetical protein